MTSEKTPGQEYFEDVVFALTDDPILSDWNRLSESHRDWWEGMSGLRFEE